MIRELMDGSRALLVGVVALVALAGSATLIEAQTAGNAACPGEDVFFNPGSAQDIIVPAGYKVEVFAKGLNFPTNIAFLGDNPRRFQVFVTEAGTSLPGRCNGVEFYKAQTGVADSANPFLPQVRILDQTGQTIGAIGRPTSVANRESPAFLHAPTIGIAFEQGFRGGRLLVSDSRQGVRGALGPKNSSRIVQLDAEGKRPLLELITGLPTGDHPTEQITVNGGYVYWSQGSVTNSGVVGHDNGGPVGGPADTAGAVQHEIPCQDVVLSGNNFDSGDGHVTGGFLPHGVPGAAGVVVPAFSGATQTGMCTGSILRARLDDPQHTVEPVSWGYRNPFGLRFAPDELIVGGKKLAHPLKGGLLLTENGEDERGARPVNNAPDRLQVVRPDQGLEYHGWPDRFGFLESTQALFNPIGGPADDCVPCAVGQPVRALLQSPPQPPIAPLALEPANVAAVGLDFAPAAFAGAGNPGNPVGQGDAVVSREGDFGFSPANGEPEHGHDIELVHFLADGRVQLTRFAFNCAAADQITDPNGSKRCAEAGEQAFVDRLRAINRPVDGKFGPDGAFYLVDFGAVRDFGRSDPRSMFTNSADAPLVQIPGTGVIWKISKR
jgi:glucose/arabinose dehydrogenase